MDAQQREDQEREARRRETEAREERRFQQAVGCGVIGCFALLVMILGFFLAFAWILSGR